jgi:hypothetical protein
MTEYRCNTFKGKRINCGDKRPSNEKQIEELYVLSNSSDTVFRQPLGFHLRVRLDENTTMALFSALLTKHFRKYGYVPLRYTVKEKDETGFHYHIAIIIEGKKNKKSVISNLLAKLKRAGRLHDYDLISPKAHPFGHPLQRQEDKDDFFAWVSYLAKTRTKVEGVQSSSPSKTLAALIKDWKRKGKPDLCRSEESTTHDLSSLFMDELTPPQVCTQTFLYKCGSI